MRIMRGYIRGGFACLRPGTGGEPGEVVLLVLVLLPQVVLGRSAGITGASGKQGMFCNQCHAGGTAPTVTLSGPSSLLPGGSSTYTVTISGGAGQRAGFNAAASDGTLMPGAGALAMNGEVTHTTPMVFSMGAVAFSFTYVAPMTAGPVTLFAAGNSVNFNMNNQGDLAATASMTVMVGMPGATTDAGAGPADAGTGGTGPVVGGTGGGGGVAALDGGSGPADGTAMVVPGGRKQPPGYSGGVVDGGCSAAGGLPFLLLAVAMLIRRRAA